MPDDYLIFSDEQLVSESAKLGVLEVQESFGVNFKESEAKDGTGLIRILTPGQGSSGFYPKEVVKRDAPKIFRGGTHMYWNHAKEGEPGYREEGNLNHQAGALTGPAYWDEAEGGVVAPYKILSEYRERVNERAALGLIEISWRGFVKFTEGQVAGKPTKIVQQMTAAESVDFVTRAGRGGKIIKASESAVAKPQKKDGVMEVNEQDYNALKAKVESAAALESKINDLVAENKKLKADGNLSVARRIIQEGLKNTTLTDKAKEKTETLLLKDVPTKDDKVDEAALKTVVEEYVKDMGIAKESEEEEEESQESRRGKVKLEGTTKKEETKYDEKKATDLFKRLGLNEKVAESAARGGR